MKEQPRNRSSPEIDLAGASEEKRLVSADKRETTDDSKDETLGVISSKQHLSQSTISGVSIQTTATLVGAEQLEEGEGGGEGLEEEMSTPLQKISFSLTSEESSTRSERAGTIHSDMSGSCSTLQNERADGDIESSTEGVKKQQMSVMFRQELLSVSQVKTDSRIGLEVAKLTEPSFDLVQLLGRSLPHVVPNVTLSKREVGVAPICGCG